MSIKIWVGCYIRFDAWFVIHDVEAVLQLIQLSGLPQQSGSTTQSQQLLQCPGEWHRWAPKPSIAASPADLVVLSTVATFVGGVGRCWLLLMGAVCCQVLLVAGLYFCWLFIFAGWFCLLVPVVDCWLLSGINDWTSPAPTLLCFDQSHGRQTCLKKIRVVWGSSFGLFNEKIARDWSDLTERLPWRNFSGRSAGIHVYTIYCMMFLPWKLFESMVVNDRILWRLVLAY